jgi:hypothetical protein
MQHYIYKLPNYDSARPVYDTPFAHTTVSCFIFELIKNQHVSLHNYFTACHFPPWPPMSLTVVRARAHVYGVELSKYGASGSVPQASPVERGQ